MTKWVRDDGGDVNNADGLAYAKFIDTFAKALHAADKELSLDFFTDLPICAASRSSFPGRRSSFPGCLSCPRTPDHHHHHHRAPPFRIAGHLLSPSAA